MKRQILTCAKSEATAVMMVERSYGTIPCYFKRFADAVSFIAQEGLDAAKCHIHKVRK